MSQYVNHMLAYILYLATAPLKLTFLLLTYIRTLALLPADHHVELQHKPSTIEHQTNVYT